MTAPEKSSHGQMLKNGRLCTKEPVREALVIKLQPARTGCSVVKSITTLP